MRTLPQEMKRDTLANRLTSRGYAFTHYVAYGAGYRCDPKADGTAA